ncbi:MAG: hypothetical protein PG981_001088 [Wolbachia endosymbiont of Ctenocephalides orientis wCori]|nr:MAG: hypothetical protein PG981_001088 [Wolbachia endosymbiont of Ctenocephalides orientis wCori]
MKNFFSNNNGDGDSSIFHAKIREEDLATQQKINEAKRLIEELKRQAKAKEKIYEQVKNDTENKLNGLLDEIEVDLKDKQSDDYLAKALEDLYELFGSFFRAFDVNLGTNFYYELREKKNRALLLSIIKSMIDKFKKLIRKLFTQDLTWDKRLDKEIAELEEALDSGELDEEQTLKNLKRLDLLKRMKLRIQLYAIGLIFTAVFSALGFGFKIEISEEITKEAHEKVEKLEEGARKEEGPAEAKEAKIKEDKEFRQNTDNLIKPLADLQKFVAPKKEPVVPIKPSLDLSSLLDKLKLFKPEEIKPAQKEVKQEKPQPVASQPAQKAVAPPPPKIRQAKPFSKTPKGNDDSEVRCVSIQNVNAKKVPTTQLFCTSQQKILTSPSTQEMDALLNNLLCSEKENCLGGDVITQSTLNNSEIQSKIAEPHVEGFESSRSRT